MADFFQNGTACYKCGLPLGFKKLPSGKWCSINPDGSDHWDLCRATRIAAMSDSERAALARADAIRGAPRRTGNQGLTYCGDTPPWDETLAPFRKFSRQEKREKRICQ